MDLSARDDGIQQIDVRDAANTQVETPPERRKPVELIYVDTTFQIQGHVNSTFNQKDRELTDPYLQNPFVSGVSQMSHAPQRTPRLLFLAHISPTPLNYSRVKSAVPCSPIPKTFRHLRLLPLSAPFERYF